MRSASLEADHTGLIGLLVTPGYDPFALMLSRTIDGVCSAVGFDRLHPSFDQAKIAVVIVDDKNLRRFPSAFFL